VVLFALSFVFGAWLLQQQPVLPSFFIGLQPPWVLVPAIAAFAYINLGQFQQYPILKKLCGVGLVILVGFLCGFVWAANCAAARLSDELPADWQQKSITVVGVIATLPELTERGKRFRFDVEKILTKNAIVPKHISLNFYRDMVSQRPENGPSQFNYFHAAERWQFTVRLKRPHTTYNPHGFDFEAWALAENIRATGSIQSKSGYKKLANFVYKPSYIIENLREKVGNYISQTLINKPYAGVIRALVVGDDSQISAADWNVYFRTGVNHLMSISGLHITMLAGMAFSIVGFAWRRLPSLVLRMPTRKAATIAGLVVAVLYALLAGMSVPTQRTLYMLLTFALALLVGKNLAISRALAMAVLVVVLLDPWAVIAPGFWLSFSAVVLIAYVMVGRLKPATAFKTALNTQWAITLGLLPLLIVMFGQVSIISPVANAFAIPLISLIVVPMAILGSAIHVDFILHAAHFILELCMQGLVYLSSLPTWQQPAPPTWALPAALLGIICLLLPSGFPQRWLGFILLLPLFYVQPAKLAQGEMQATVLDVGQGLAVVIKTKNHTFLYDAGPSFSAQSDAGGRIIVPFLRGEGIKKLDGFMVSHNDVDHSGGAASVLAQIPVTWLASSFDTTKLNTKEISIKKSIKCYAGQHWAWDGVNFAVLYPTLESYQDTDLTDNNKSCVVKVTSQFGSLLLTGDIEKQAENILLDDATGLTHSSAGLQANNGAGGVNHLKSDVLIAPHHGSKTSSTADFIQAVGAKHVIFTVGYLNRFKHPKPLIEKRYKESGAFNYRSDYQGALDVIFNAAQGLQVKSWRELQPKYWHDTY
jgi:competence protein ComEC